jgi:hypothetical protein
MKLIEGTMLKILVPSNLFNLSRLLPLDAGARLSHRKTMVELRGRFDFMAIQSCETMGNIERAGLLRDKAEIARAMQTRGTSQFFKGNGPPLKPPSVAMELDPD